MRLLNESGYALPSVLLISLLVITAILGLLSVIHFINKATIKLTEKKKLELACFSAVQKALTDSTILQSDVSMITCNSINITLNSDNYGFFKKITASANGITDSIRINYIIGTEANENYYFKNAIVISRPNLRATVVGNTEIVGNVLCASERIIPGNIYGMPPLNKNYLKGAIITDQNIDPQLIPDSLFDELSNNFSTLKHITVENEIYVLNESNILKLETELVNSFTNDIEMSGEIISKQNEIIRLQTPGKLLFIEGVKCNLHMEISSDSLVIINKNIQLENAIIYCSGPIIIEEGSHFRNVQFFSSDSISVKGSQFDFPSIVCLSIDDTDSSKLNKAIVIENSIVNGSIILMTKTAGFSSNKTKIKVDEQSKVQGLVYSENNLELYGDVTGTIYTYNFWYYIEPTEYFNWLINVKVNRNELDSWFLLPTVFDIQAKSKIIKAECVY